MSLHIGHMVSDVTTEDEGHAATAPRHEVAIWQQLAMLRRLQARAMLDDARTAAFGSED